MTFADQVRWSRVWGLRMMLFGAAGVAVVLGLAFALRGTVATPFPLAEVPMLVTLAGFVLWGVGGWVRPVHRRVFLTVIAPNDFWRASALWLPIMRHWAWVNPAGKDRDG